MFLANSLMNCDYIEAYIVINEVIVLQICERLQIEPYSLFKLKPLRKYDEQLAKKSITHCLLFILNVHDYKKGFYPILIAQLKHHDLIIKKL